jgi:hypothetical protein
LQGQYFFPAHEFLFWNTHTFSFVNNEIMRTCPLRGWEIGSDKKCLH